MEPLSVKEILIAEHLIANGDVLRAGLRPNVELWKADRHLYTGVLDTFDDAYKAWLVGQITVDTTRKFQLTYEEASYIIDFDLLKDVWKLDEDGWNV